MSAELSVNVDGPMTVAVIVTYYPDCDALPDRVSRILDQVGGVVIVDNGTPEEIQACLRETIADGVRWLSLGDNFGIARAQNIGIDCARSLGATHLVLFDQDSDPAPNMVARLLEVAEHFLRKGVPVAAITPKCTDARHTKQIPFGHFSQRHAKWFGCQEPHEVLEIHTAIASGSLIPMQAINNLGGMREDLFIDLVDVEWCLRAISNNYRIFAVCDVVLQHTLGEPPKKFLGRELTIHSPLRSYYFYRNATWLFRQSYVPAGWKRAVASQMLKRLAFFPLGVSPRLQYLRMMTLGVWHGLHLRLGRLDTSPG